MHGAACRDELERKMAAYGGTRKKDLEVLALVKGIGLDWVGNCVKEPKLEYPHSGSLEQVPFVGALKRYLIEYPVCKPVHIQKETTPNEVKPRSKWVPMRGSTLSKNMRVGKGNKEHQHGAYTMEVLEMLVYGGAAGTETSGRSFVGLQMQMHKDGLASLSVRKLSDTLEIEFKGACSHTHGPDWWFRVQMVFLENMEDEKGVDKIWRGKPFLWVDMEIVRHGAIGDARPGAAWRGITEKLLNYILHRARDMDDHHGLIGNFPSLAMGAMKKKWEEIKTDGVLRRPLLNFNSQEEAKQDADRWCSGHLLGSRTVADADDGTPAQVAQVGSQPAMPMEMLLQAIQASACKNRAEREKEAEFNLAREMKLRDATEARLLASLAREDRLREKALKIRKKSIGGK